MKKSEMNLEKLYNFLKEFTLTNSYPPTVREMAAELDVKSTSTIAYYLDKLEKAGKIKKSEGKNRALEIVGLEKPSFASNKYVPDFMTNTIPMLGTITAGQPILAHEEYDEVYNMPADLFGRDQLFMLTIKGESMIEAGIYDGDKIIVRKQNNASNGDIVAVMVEDEATCKRFYKEQGYYRLQPENSTMEPIIAKEVTILGKVVGLIRNL